MNGSLTVRDESDIAHLATAIEECAAGFVTSEKAVLSCGDWLRENHGIEILSPEVLGQRYTAATRTSTAYQVRVAGQAIIAADLRDEEKSSVRGLLASLDVPSQIVKEALAQGTSVAPRRRLIVRTSDQVIAFGSWAPATPNAPSTMLYLFAEENDAASEAAIDHVLEEACRDASVASVAVLKLSSASDQVSVRTRALALGFRAVGSGSLRTGELEKLCLGMVVTERNWSSIRQRVLDVAGIELPEEAPLFVSSSDRVTLRAQSAHSATTTLGALEDFLFPAIFALKGRSSVIVPIKPRYVEALFRGSTQPSFLDEQQAALLRQRRYLGSDRTYGSIPEQGLLFFYESSAKGLGRSAAVAIARIVRRYLVEQQEAEGLARDGGVLTGSEVRGIGKGGQLCVTEFDNVMKFKHAVPLEELKSLGCADNSNMVTARALDIDAAVGLIERGEPKCAH